jgi:hypothetical protein
VRGLARPPVFPKPYVGTWISQPNVTDDFYADGQAAELSAGLIEDVLSTQPKPWFLAVGLWKPHVRFYLESFVKEGRNMFQGFLFATMFSRSNISITSVKLILQCISNVLSCLFQHCETYSGSLFLFKAKLYYSFPCEL